MTVMLTVNLLASFVSPFIFIIAAFALPNDAVKWTLLVMYIAVWCGTAIVANSMAGHKVKTHWYTAVLPFVITLPVCVFLTYPKFEYILLGLLVDIILNVLMCVVPLLISASLQRKKAIAQVEKIENTLKENNETI